MFNRCRLAGLGAAFIGCCTVFVVGCHTAHPAPAPASSPQTQAAHGSRPFERIGEPFRRDDLFSSLNDIVLSGDGLKLLVPESANAPASSTQWQARVWDAMTAKPLTRPFPLGRIDHGLSFDGATALTTDPEHIWVWDVATSRLRWETKLRQTPGVSAGAALSPDGTEIVAASEVDKSLKVWRVGSDQPKFSIQQADVANSVDFDPTGKRIASVSDGELQIYDAQSGQQLFTGYPTSISNLRQHFDSGGRRFLDLYNGDARVIDANTGEPRLRIESTRDARDARWSADSDQIIQVTFDNEVDAYDAATGRIKHIVYGDDVSDFWVLHGGRWAVCQSRNKPLEIWDLTAHRKVQTLDGCQYCLRDPAGSTLVTSDGTAFITIWRLRADFK
jgi:WD40 repeat protein